MTAVDDREQGHAAREAVGPTLEGRRVLVTGASSGIGLATARAIASAGGRVALLARRHEVIAAEAGRLDGVAVPADVTDVAVVRRAVDRAAEVLGGLDGVVNAAGVLRPGDVGASDPSDWRLMMEVNVLGVLTVTQAALPHLRAAAGGSAADVVNVSSMNGRRLSRSSLGVYAATKAAVHMASEGLRRELADDGVRVTVVAPGLVATDLFATDDDTSASLRDRAGEVGLTPEVVGRSIVGVLGAPRGVVHVEVALLGLGQG